MIDKTEQFNELERAVQKHQKLKDSIAEERQFAKPSVDMIEEIGPGYLRILLRRSQECLAAYEQASGLLLYDFEGQAVQIRPRRVCLCGSTRFREAFQQASLQETLAGKIVLSIGVDFKSDQGDRLTEADKARLDELHLRKIDIADEVLILDVNGYIGESTAREITYAHQHEKRLRWWQQEQDRKG